MSNVAIRRLEGLASGGETESAAATAKAPAMNAQSRTVGRFTMPMVPGSVAVDESSSDGCGGHPMER